MTSISICTVCMNRLSFLSQTLPLNIMENLDYSDVEFVLLDYNSKDGMEEWVKGNLWEHIESGRLKYYKTREPEYFHMAHSKNMALKLATGDVLCVLDADNYAGPGYARWIAETFAANGPGTVITTLNEDNIQYPDQGGKMCVSRELFNAVSGFDEGLVGYGMDDLDIVNRLVNAGGTRRYILDEKWLRYIGHSDEVRLSNYRYTNELERMYYRIDQGFEERPAVLYLFRDGTFSDMLYTHKQDLKNNVVASFSGWMLGRNDLRKGHFLREDDIIRLKYDDGTDWAGRLDGQKLKQISSSDGKNQLMWKELDSNNRFYFMAVLGFCECFNRRRFEENDRNENIINPGGWGRGTVCRNFDASRSITIV